MVDRLRQSFPSSINEENCRMCMELKSKLKNVGFNWEPNFEYKALTNMFLYVDIDLGMQFVDAVKNTNYHCSQHLINNYLKEAHNIISSNEWIKKRIQKN